MLLLREKSWAREKMGDLLQWALGESMSFFKKTPDIAISLFRLQLVCFLWGSLWDNLDDDSVGYLCWPLPGDHKAPAVHPVEFQETHRADHRPSVALLTGMERGSAPWLEYVVCSLSPSIPCVHFLVLLGV